MFDSEKEAEGLDSSTFDILKIDAFHNTRFWTVLSFLWVWIVLIFKMAILGGDTYTCVSILVFNRWSTQDYDVYEYKVAKWIFTGCIFFRFLLLAYQVAWGIHIYRTRNIALAYLNNYARLMYAIRSYSYQCLFHEIDQEGFFEWACFHVYTELDNALEVLVADLPRQVINFMTLRYYATGGELNNAILSNIKAIATTNLRLSIILSFQLSAMVLFLFFFFKFLLALVLYIPVKVKVANKGFKSLKAYCYRSVNENVRFLVKRNHKSKAQILDEGVLDLKEIQANPLLGSTSTFDTTSWSRPGDAYPLGSNRYTAMNASANIIYDQTSRGLSASHMASKESLSQLHRPPYHSQSMSSLRENPFADTEMRDLPEYPTNPFAGTSGDTTAVPMKVMPPMRSQTSESLASRRTMGNYEMSVAGSQTFNKAFTSTDFVNSHHGSNVSLPYSGIEHSSNTHLLQRKFGSTDSTSHASSVSSGQSLIGEAKLQRDESEALSDGTDNDISFDAGSKSSGQSKSDIPYPVRGVSRYFEDHSDV
ncbi:hypothetical protein OXX80_010656 [Metschnikowia pulcherrima]